MTRMALVPWCDAVLDILGLAAPDHDMFHDMCQMWRSGQTPVEAAAAITVAEFERTLQS